MDQNNKLSLADGGKAVVMIGNTGYVKEYANNPQIRFIDTKETPVDKLDELVGTDTKVAIITEGMSQGHYMWITAYCNRRKVPYLLRKSNQAIYDTLKSFFPKGTNVGVTQDEAEKSRGKLQDLIPYIDWNKSNAENGRALFQIAGDKRIKTTLGSVIQLVSIQRRKQGRTDKPKSLRSQLDVSVELLDSAIKNIGDIRDYLIQVTEENRILRTKVDKFKKVMEE